MNGPQPERESIVQLKDWLREMEKEMVVFPSPFYSFSRLTKEYQLTPTSTTPLSQALVFLTFHSNQKPRIMILRRKSLEDK
jgi:hypothetical protein